MTLTLHPNTILETGRVSYFGVIMQMPRKGGVRECIAARPGTVFGSCDFEGGELVTHAQSCKWIVGWSKLADALLDKKKPHNLLAATMSGIDYETFNARLDAEPLLSAYRQAAKPGNFGFPGGMGEWKLVLQQRKQGPDTEAPEGSTWIHTDDDRTVRGYKGLRFCILMRGAKRCGVIKVTEYKKKPGPPTCLACIECAAELRSHWYRTYPENKPYFDFVSKQVEDHGYVVQHVDKRIRGGVNFTSAANGYFQALLARAAKLALIRASKECYVGSTALRGSRIIVFQHDEIIAEHPESVAPEACDRLSWIMENALKETCPDLAPACKAEPTLMRRWYKDAKCVRDKVTNRLQVWEPKKVAA